MAATLFYPPRTLRVPHCLGSESRRNYRGTHRLVRPQIGWGDESKLARVVTAGYDRPLRELFLQVLVEPEVLMDGDHTLERCGAVTQAVLHVVFDQLDAQRVLLEGMLLKPNMVLPGVACCEQDSVDAVADATVRCLLRGVPAAVPGIAFLSGGQTAELASARLNAMNLRFKSGLPWALTFSFARAIQQPALEAWRGVAANVPAAQRALFHRADCNRAARRGRYDPDRDTEINGDADASRRA